MLKRRLNLFVVLSVILVLLAACGSNKENNANAGASPSATEPAATTSASPSAEPSESPAADVERSIKHVLGETKIKGTPQKVVVLEWTYAEDLLAVGVQPAGVSDIENMKKYVALPIELAADVQEVGTRQEPNLETITALEPDLIIGVKFRHEKIFDQLSAIAPTLLFDPYPPEGTGDQYQEMVETFTTIADVVGKKAEAEAVLADLQKTFDELRAKLAGAGKEGASIVLAMPYVNQNAIAIRLSTDNSLAIKILEHIGLNNVYQPEQFEAYGFSTRDVEALPALQDANYLHMTTDEGVAGMLEKNSVWTGLNFVKENRTYALGGDTWPYGGPYAAKIMAERTTKVLLGE